LRTVSHGGSFNNFNAELIRFPGQRFSVICLCNVENAGPIGLARRVADIYLSEQLKPSEMKTKLATTAQRRKRSSSIFPKSSSREKPDFIET